MSKIIITTLLALVANGIIFLLSYYIGKSFIYYIATIIVFIIYLISIYKINRNLIITSSYTIFAMLTTVTISIFLEYNIFLIEINQTSYPINLPIKAVFQLISFIFGASLAFTFFSKSNLQTLNLPPKLNSSINKILYISILALSLILVAIGTAYGTPTTLGLHRNDYWTYTAPSWGAVLVYFLIQITFVLGLNYSKNKKKIDLYFYLYILFIIILMGERFTGILYSIVFFTIPLLINHTQITFNISMPKKLFLLGAAVFLLGVTVSKSFSSIDKHTSSSENIILRASLQPQMWWALDNLSTNKANRLDLITKKYFGFNESERNSGTYYLMDQVSSPSLVDARFDTQSKFTMSGFFSQVYFFGYWFGAIVNILWGIFFGFLCYLFYLGITANNIIFGFISFKLLYKVQALLLVGSITDLFSLGTLIFTLICMFFLRLR